MTVNAGTTDRFAKECFLSVRVGDEQKISRLSQSRVYKFPQAGDRTYGKVELFRRVGSCTVDIDAQNSGTREVSFDCGDIGVLKLGVDIGDTAKAGELAPAQKEPEQKDEKSKGAQVAKDYLRKHSVELQLAEAMQAVLRERPDNPVQFLAENLLSNLGGAGIALPPPSANKTEAPPTPGPAPLQPFAQYAAAHFRQMPQDGFDKMHSRFSGAAAAPAPGTPDPAPMQPFASYVASHFRQMPLDGFQAIYSRFPALSVVVEFPVSAAPVSA
eukprot:CAMPEP_0170333574 /NCGR_PEP_ID=MMETSP0116_2-20130129/67813_1 /TAXON_ID=400756 /ORGANISM="Durinskia baltica, Strain CSIRO CS-38" /LENGTH=270 /DNA_ID=CAMNT_0010586929 /DNA_START=84 /DNA_END=892 /DNA_ORIENTATION=-